MSSDLRSLSRCPGENSEVYRAKCEQYTMHLPASEFVQDTFCDQGNATIPISCGAHPTNYSVRPGRVIRSRMADCALLSSWRMAATCSVMGISTPCLAARPRAAVVVRTPSATLLLRLARISA